MKLLKQVPTVVLATFVALSTAGLHSSATAAEAKSKKTTKKKSTSVKNVNNSVCPVMDAAVGSMGDAVPVVHKGYRVNLCCGSCVSKFKESPDAYLQRALGSGAGSSNASTPAAAPTQKVRKGTQKNTGAAKVVNNAHCPIAGSPIGSMGAGTAVTHKGYQVSLCCGGCTAKFNSNPDQYLQAALADSKRQ